MGASKLRFSRLLMIATPWSPSEPETRITSPGRARLPPSSSPSGSTPTPVVVMKMPSPLPRSTTLVSPVTTGTPASRAAPGHGFDDARQVGQRKAFFEDEAGGKVKRLGAHHRDVIDRAMHRKAADVAAGKEQRRDHVESVDITRRPGRPLKVGAGNTAPSLPWPRYSLPRCLANSSEISCTMARPPEPWVMSTRPCFKSSGRT
jgi:hypothetical protein